jgi:hypothetical protein
VRADGHLARAQPPHQRSVVQRQRVEHGARRRGVELHVEHLVEVAVVQPAVVADRERAAAHHARRRRRVEGVDERRHVLDRLAARLEELEEARDRHVGDRVQAVEDDAEAALHLALVPRLERRLIAGQEGTHRVRHQVQLEPRALAVAERVEAAQPLERLLEDAGAALRVGLARLEVRQRRDHLRADPRQQCGNVGVVGEQDGGQVAAVHDARAGRGAALHQLAEVGMQLGRAAGDVEARRARAREQRQAALDHVARHDLLPVGSRVDVAVMAGLVAPLAEVDLQDVDAGRAQRPEAAGGQRLLERARDRQLGQARALRGGGGQRRHPLLHRRQHARGARGRRRRRRAHGPAHIPSRCTWLRICTPCTSDAPPRIAAATCSASVISSRLLPWRSASVEYASMQYGHCTACATASAISDFSRTVSAPSAKTAPYQSKNFFASSGAASPMSPKRARSGA